MMPSKTPGQMEYKVPQSEPEGSHSQLKNPLSHGVTACHHRHFTHTRFLHGDCEMCLECCRVQDLISGRESETGFDKESAALDGAGLVRNAVSKMGPTSFPAREDAKVKTALEYVFVEGALGVCVIRCTVLAIPDAEFRDIQTKYIGRELLVIGCEERRRPQGIRLA
jgi:hypothetical protein